MSESTIITSEKIFRCFRSSFTSIAEVTKESLIRIDVNDPLYLADGTEPPQSLTTRVGVEWNDKGILIFFRGRFEHLRMISEGKKTGINSKTYKLWEQSDVFEVFIGVNVKQTKLYKEFQVSPDAQWIDIDVNKQLKISNHHWYSGFQCRSFIDDDMKIWTSVFELPWNCFGLNKKIGDVWHANFYRASGSFHGEELLAWSPTGYGEKCFHRPEYFGKIEFIQ
ncbi:MAG: carbohydrate-binding family 9-like protein [Bacteroidota bacterium]|nr:carbohydrate-binding family 9-like protein [Bacteroidota bacterium]